MCRKMINMILLVLKNVLMAVIVSNLQVMSMPHIFYTMLYHCWTDYSPYWGIVGCGRSFERSFYQHFSVVNSTIVT